MSWRHDPTGSIHLRPEDRGQTRFWGGRVPEVRVSRRDRIIKGPGAADSVSEGTDWMT